MKLILRTTLLVGAMLALFTSCGEEPNVGPKEPTVDTAFAVSVKELVFDLQGEVKTFKIEAKGDWTVESSESWCAISRDKGFANATIEVTVEKATTSRNATIYVKSGEIKHQISVKQEKRLPGSIKFLNKDIVDDKMITRRTAVKDLVVSLELNVDHELKIVGGEWLTIASIDTLAPVDGMQRINYKFETQENAQVEKGRTAVLNFNYVDQDQNLTARLDIYQQGSRDRETLLEIHKLLGIESAEDVWSTIVSKDNNHVHEVVFDLNNDQKNKVKELLALVKKFTELQSFALAGAVMPTIDPAIFELTTIETLNLQRNQISSINVDDFDKLPRLGILFLRGNLLTQMPDFLSNLRELWGLDLGENKIAGQIPTNIARNSKFTSLFLDGNLFSGPIPAEIGNLEQLASLSLNNNKLEGTIPEALGNCANLVQFRANNNLLTGEIPASVDNLMKIKDFNVNDNDMSGELSDKIHDELNNPAFKDVWKVCLQRGKGFSNCKGR